MTWDYISSVLLMVSNLSSKERWKIRTCIHVATCTCTCASFYRSSTRKFKDVGYATTTLGHSGSGGCCSSHSLYLHGRVMILYDLCYTSTRVSSITFVNNRLGEACSHIATLLSCVVKAAEACQVQGSNSCTSQKCVWLPPARNVR